MADYLALADKNLSALNDKVNAALADGMQPAGGLTFRYGIYAQAVYRPSAFTTGAVTEYQVIGANTPQELTAEVQALAGSGLSPDGGVYVFDGIYLQSMLEATPDSTQFVRMKSECYFSGLSLVIPTADTNLINLIKALPHSGSLSPFFNTTTNKFNVFNQDTTVTFKLNIIGSWSGSSTNRSMTVDFPQTNGNSLTKTRDAQVTTDALSFPTFFSVDKDGNLATNGSDITIKSNGATFTVSEILLVAEQMAPAP